MIPCDDDPVWHELFAAGRFSAGDPTQLPPRYTARFALPDAHVTSTDSDGVATHI